MTDQITTAHDRITDDVDDAQAVKTLAHELGHVLFHDNIDRTSNDRPRIEIEAESVAYLVCHQLGIVSDDYSFAYLVCHQLGFVSDDYSFAYLARWSNGDTNLIDHAAYVADWLALLSADSPALVSACRQAQRAIDFLNDTAGWAPFAVDAGAGADTDTDALTDVAV